MARAESDREDLLREATALVERAELRIPAEQEPVTVGFRRDGALGIYFGADPVYQFNAAGQLRRAYVGGLLYKAESGRLVALRRERTAAEVILRRHDLDIAETARFLQSMGERLSRLLSALEGKEYDLLGEVSAAGTTLARVQHFLASIPPPAPLAEHPNV
jgi:hypothetical protein